MDLGHWAVCTEPLSLSPRKSWILSQTQRLDQCQGLKFSPRTLQVVGVVTRDELTELTMKGQELIEVMRFIQKIPGLKFF